MFRARGLGAGCAGYYWRVIVLVPLRGHGWAMYVPIRIYSKILKNRFTLICVTPVQQHRIHSSIFPFCICNFFLSISMVGQTVFDSFMGSQIWHQLAGSVALGGEGLEKGQWLLLSLMTDTSVSPCIPLVPFKLLPWR